MNTRLHAIVGSLILLLGITHQGALMAQDMTVISANPSHGEQGESNVPIDIVGTGFDESIDKVSFKLPCNKKTCPDSDDITVMVIKIEPTLIQAQINISETAPTATFDIAVRSTRGRGGKGTTYKGEGLFTVKLRPNQDIYACDDFLENPLGTCNCQFVWNGDPSFRPALLEDCETSETLNFTHAVRGSEGGSADGTGRTTITAVPCGGADNQLCADNGGVVAVGSFAGRSVIANATHRASIRYMDIRFGNVERGCGNGIEAAVSFVLDATTPDPKADEPLNRNSFLNIRDIGVFSGSEEDEPLCRAIEIIRTPEYTAKWSTEDLELPARDWKVYINDNQVSDGSYQQAGIVMLGMMPSESINPPSVFGNSVGNASCSVPELPETASTPVGILYGSLTFDWANQIDGVVESNVIDMSHDCEVTEATGIKVIGDTGVPPDPDDPGDPGIPAGIQTTVKVNKNTITGAHIGVDVDDNVVHVNFSGNTLQGDAGDTGILSVAQCTETKGKPNKISGYTTDISDAGCSP